MGNRSALLESTGVVRIVDLPMPEAGPHQVIVQIEAVGICGSDCHYYDHGRIGPYVVTAPLVLGHEAAGTVTAVGAGVTDRVVGHHVAIEPGVPCRHCAQCLSGRYNLCPDVEFLATPPIHGALTQYLAVDAGFTHVVPDGMSLDRAAMAEPVSVGVWAARRAGITAGDRVLVTGAGPVGLLAAQVARAFGAVQVACSDVSPFRLGIAEKLGLTALDASAPLAGSFDVLLECSGSQAALTAGLSVLDRQGRAALVGMGAETVAINLPLVQDRELTITGSFRYANTYPLALQLIADGHVDVDTIVTHRLPLDQSDDALTIGRRDSAALKVVVLPQVHT